MDPEAELLEPTTPDGSDDGDAPEEAGELDYEPSEPDGASPANSATIRYQVCCSSFLFHFTLLLLIFA